MHAAKTLNASAKSGFTEPQFLSMLSGAWTCTPGWVGIDRYSMADAAGPAIGIAAAAAAAAALLLLEHPLQFLTLLTGACACFHMGGDNTAGLNLPPLLLLLVRLAPRQLRRLLLLLLLKCLSP